MKFTLSLHARIAIFALLMAGAMLAVAGYSLVQIVTYAVTDNLDDKIDVQIDIIERAFDGDGDLRKDRLFLYPELRDAGSNWGWYATSPKGGWHGGTAVRDIVFPYPKVHPSNDGYSGNAVSDSGLSVHVRRRDRPSSKISIMIVTPNAVIWGPIGRTRSGVYLVLGFLGFVILLISFLQVRYGLQPVRRFRDAVDRVRLGEAQTLSTVQPSELRPLATEMNALIARNEAGLEHARNHVANLAHAVKTPLASLALQLELENASSESMALVTQIGTRIDHHLRRARSAATGLGARARADAREVIDELKAAFERPFQRRSLTIFDTVPRGLIVGVDREDLAEMLGNLLENAGRYARTRLSISASVDKGAVILRLEDDGAGIPAALIASALQPGVRLDETTAGYGLGLAIVRELAELYGGNLRLDNSAELGGLEARLSLPRASNAA